MLFTKKEDISIFLVLISMFIIYERVYSFLFHKEQDGKIYFKWLTIIPSLAYSFIIFFAITEFIFVRKSINYILMILGAGFLVFAFILRRKSMQALGMYWSNHIKIYPTHRLIKQGLYKKFRHPYLFSVGCELLGFCLFLNSFFSLSLVFFVQVPLLILRGFFEEKILLNYFNAEYLGYSRATIFL